MGATIENTSCQIFRYEKYWRSPEAHKGFDGDVVRDISIQGAVAITWCRTPAHGWKTNAFEHRHRQARVSGSVSYESLKIFAETASEHKASLVPTDRDTCSASTSFGFWLYAVPICAACSTSASTCRSPLMLLWSASWCSPSVHQTWYQTVHWKMWGIISLN